MVWGNSFSLQWVSSITLTFKYFVFCLFSAFVGQATGKKGSSSIGTGKQTLRLSSKGQAKVEVVSVRY